MGRRITTRSASTGSSLTCSARPSPCGTTAKEPRSDSSRNAATADSTERSSAAVHSASVVWPLRSMRTSRDIWALLPLTRATNGTPVALHAELLADQAGDLAPVRTALGLPHDGADQRADRLRVAAAHLVGRVGVRLDRARDDLGQLAVLSSDRRQVLGFDDRRGVAPLGHETGEHLL